MNQLSNSEEHVLRGTMQSVNQFFFFFF